MILQLNPPIPIFSVPHQEEGWAYLVMEYSQEDYLYFLFSLDSTGELWVLPNTDLRVTKNFTQHRASINKEAFSEYLKMGARGIQPKGKPNIEEDK